MSPKILADKPVNKTKSVSNISFFKKYFSPHIHWVYYLLTFALTTFLVLLIGLPGSFLSLGFPSLYASILGYNIAATIAFTVNYSFYNTIKLSDIMKRKITIICALSLTIISSLFTYKLMFFISLPNNTYFIRLVLPVFCMVLNLFIAKVGNSSFHHESYHIPVLLSLLLPLAGLLPGFLNYNIVLYMAFILSYGLVKIIRQPLLRMFDTELNKIQKLYNENKSIIKGNITTMGRDQLESNLRESLVSDPNSSGSNLSSILIQLLIDKAIIRELVKNVSYEDIKKFFLYRSDSISTAQHRVIYNYYSKLSHSFKSWVDSERFKDNVSNSSKNNFLQCVLDFDFSSTRTYSLKQNSSQNSVELSSAIFILLLGSTINVFFPEFLLYLGFYGTLSALTLTMLCINLGVIYYNNNYQGYTLFDHKDNLNIHANNANNIEFKDIMGLRYYHIPTRSDDITGSISFNIYFSIICIMAVCFIFQNSLIGFYAARATSFIPWSVFWPQIIVCNATVLFTLSVLPSNYFINLNTRILFFAILLYAGILINLFCPQLLILFSTSPGITNYIVMIGFTSIATHLITVVGYDEPLSRASYESGNDSPVRGLTNGFFNNRHSSTSFLDNSNHEKGSLDNSNHGDGTRGDGARVLFNNRNNLKKGRMGSPNS